MKLIEVHPDDRSPGDLLLVKGSIRHGPRRRPDLVGLYLGESTKYDDGYVRLNAPHDKILRSGWGAGGVNVDEAGGIIFGTELVVRCWRVDHDPS